MEGQLVGERLARPDRVLSDTVDAIEAVGQLEAVAMEDGRFRQFVVEDDAHPVALVGLDGRAGHGIVVSPDVHPRPR